MLHIIVNPRSGNGQGAAAWRLVEAALAARGMDFELVATAAAGDAETWCRMFASTLPAAADEKRRTIIVVGGDGTMNEAVHGLLSGAGDLPLAKRVQIGFIAAGSGNDFARGHGLPLQPIPALERLLELHARDSGEIVDALLVNGRYAISSVGAGLDGEVAYIANHAPYKSWLNKLKLGYAAYIVSLVRVLLAYRPVDLTIELDGARTSLSRVWLTAISNIPYYGGGMKINPAARADDGIAEICVVSNLSRIGLLAAFPKVYAGKHSSHPAVSFFRGRDIRLSPAEDARLRVHADGEDAGLAPCQVRLLPRAIRVLKPQAPEK